MAAPAEAEERTFIQKGPVHRNEITNKWALTNPLGGIKLAGIVHDTPNGGSSFERAPRFTMRSGEDRALSHL